MSYILDALNKSESERVERQKLPTLQSRHGVVAAPVERKSRRLVLIAAVVACWLLTIAVLLVSRLDVTVSAGHQTAEAAPVAAAPAQQVQATAQTPAQVAMAPAADNSFSAANANLSNDELPFLTELPTSAQEGLPPLDYSAHIFSGTTSRGFVIINGRKLYSGDRLSAELKIEDVLPESVVVNWQGRRFRLAAMQNWPG